MRRTAMAACLAVMLLGSTLSTQAQHAPMRIASSPAFGSGRRSHFAPRSFFWGSPFWSDYAPSDSRVIVIQPPTQAAPEKPTPQIEEHKSAAPLLIEWQGDRYVRRTSESQSNAAHALDYTEANPGARSIPSTATPRTAVQPQLPPTIFVFRDGHREQSSDYSIISGIIYTRADFWATGSWSKHISLSQLDLPSTFQANQEQGVTFRLPSAPNEVITRP